MKCSTSSLCALIAAPLMLIGCATTAPPAPEKVANPAATIEGQETFVVSRPVGPGAPGFAQAKADALREADHYCASLNKGLKVQDTSEERPAPGKPTEPKYEVRFSCQAIPEAE